jgi:hypothetical protein
MWEVLSDEERARIAELAATRLPGRLIAKEVGLSHRAVWSYVLRLRQPAPAERRRAPLRLSLAEREEISRGLAGGTPRGYPLLSSTAAPLVVASHTAPHRVAQRAHEP